MPISPRSNSRYLNTDSILTPDGQPTYGLLKKFKFLDRNNLPEEQIDNIVVDADIAKRPDRLAERIYGDRELSWILILFNHVENPLNWPALGQVVEYPTLGIVSAEL